MSCSSVSESPIDRSVVAIGCSRVIAGKSEPTSSRLVPSMSARYLIARRSKTSES
jgi:hypothetical protein